MSTVGIFTLRGSAGGQRRLARLPRSRESTNLATSRWPDIMLNVSTPPNCSWTAGETVEWLAVTDARGRHGAWHISVSRRHENTNPANGQPSVVVNGVELAFTQAGTGCGDFTVEPANRRTRCRIWRGMAMASPSRLGRAARGRRRRACRGCTCRADPAPERWPTRPTRKHDVFDRTGTLTVQGVPIAVTQRGAPQPTTCTYTLTPPTFSLGAAPGGGTFTVTPSGACAWSARSEADWITLTPPAAGTGVGPVTFQTLANVAGNRSGTILVAGKRVTRRAARAESGRRRLAWSMGPSTGYRTSPERPDDGAGRSTTGGYRRVDLPARGARRHVGEPSAARNAPDEVFVGAASSSAARGPTFEQLFPTTVNNDRGGWGFMLLTNQLPGSNGTFTFVFRARDGIDKLTARGR